MEVVLMSRRYRPFGYRHSVAAAVLATVLGLFSAGLHSQETAALLRFFEEVRAAAENGDPEMQVWLGDTCRDGSEGVAEDPATAVRWHRLAAEQGNATAQRRVGFAYDLGQGVTENDTEAVKWYRLAAEQGDASAQFFLGLMYSSGEGVPENGAEAVRWYRLAADQGNAGAQYLPETLDYPIRASPLILGRGCPFNQGTQGVTAEVPTGTRFARPAARPSARA